MNAAHLLKLLLSSPLPYSARATQIEPRLWVGPAPELADAGALAEMRLTLVIDCTLSGVSDWMPRVGFPCERMTCAMSDRVAEQPRDLEPVLRAAMERGAAVLGRGRGAVLVHCRAGVYRSASVAYGILRLRGASMIEATRTVAKRPAALPRYLESVERVVMRALPPSAWNP